MLEMLKTLGKSVREYKRPALVTPVLVAIAIPFPDTFWRSSPLTYSEKDILE